MNVTWKRLAGAALGSVYVIALMLAIGFGLESVLSDSWRAAGWLTYAGFGAIYAGWQWPDAMLRPFTALARRQ